MRPLSYDLRQRDFIAFFWHPIAFPSVLASEPRALQYWRKPKNLKSFFLRP
jgi:hypothetical protein